jgi:aryl-alcohol dehydrogenase-like predicted oxidoreductase
MKNKIILGSANFNQLYGVKKNFIEKNEIKKLLNLSFKNDIKLIDTAPTYNKSENIIGALNNNRFKIISKIPKLPPKMGKKNINLWINKTVNSSLKILKIKKFECLLIHNIDSLLSKNGNELYKNLKSIKSKGLTDKIGISVYDFTILDKILKKFNFDLVQVPFNIFDQRLIEKKWLERLKKKKIQIHVRSIFLQGVLLLKRKQLPKKLKKLSNSWIIWEKWLKKNKLSALEACVSFVLSKKEINGVVIGCDTKNQLSEILSLKKNKINFSNFKTNIKNLKLIDPREWAK